MQITSRTIIAHDADKKEICLERWLCNIPQSAAVECPDNMPEELLLQAQMQSLVSLFLREQVATSSSTEQRYVTGQAAKGSALPAFQPHPPAFVSQLTQLRKPLPSVLQVFFSRHHRFGPPCCALMHIHAPGTPAVLLRGWLSFSLASQAQLGWQNYVVCLEQFCLSAERCHHEDSLLG